MLICVLRIVSCFMVVGWLVFSEVSRICFFLWFFRCLVSFVVVVVLFEFCRLIIRIGVGGLLMCRVLGLFLFCRILISLLWMILMICWLGVIDLVMVFLVVLVVMDLMKLCVIGSDILVLSKVMCILCMVVVMLFLDSVFCLVSWLKMLLR